MVASPAARRRRAALALLAALAAGAGCAAAAQTAAPPAKHNNNTYGSPLDTLRSTRLWTDVPTARDFVRDSRPDPRQLDYAPLTGTDPERPKPRDQANVEALQAELERDGADLARRTAKPRRAAKRKGEAARD